MHCGIALSTGVMPQLFAVCLVKGEEIIIFVGK